MICLDVLETVAVRIAAEVLPAWSQRLMQPMAMRQPPKCASSRIHPPALGVLRRAGSGHG